MVVEPGPMLRVMAAEASTSLPFTATHPHHHGPYMSRLFLLVLAVILLIGVVGALVLGTFPPTPQPQQVQRVLPNDKFAPAR